MKERASTVAGIRLTPNLVEPRAVFRFSENQPPMGREVQGQPNPRHGRGAFLHRDRSLVMRVDWQTALVSLTSAGHGVQPSGTLQAIRQSDLDKRLARDAQAARPAIDFLQEFNREVDVDPLNLTPWPAYRAQIQMRGQVHAGFVLRIKDCGRERPTCRNSAFFLHLLERK